MYKFKVYQDTSGNWRWKLVAPNGQPIAVSGESFAQKSNAHHAAENVRAHAGSADIIQ